MFGTRKKIKFILKQIEQIKKELQLTNLYIRGK